MGVYGSLVGDMEVDIKELNTIIKIHSSLLEQTIKNEWLTIVELFDDFAKEKKKEKLRQIYVKIQERSEHLGSTIKTITNDKLIPKYRNFVGETVPTLD